MSLEHSSGMLRQGYAGVGRLYASAPVACCTCVAQAALEAVAARKPADVMSAKLALCQQQCVPDLEPCLREIDAGFRSCHRQCGRLPRMLVSLSPRCAVCRSSFIVPLRLSQQNSTAPYHCLLHPNLYVHKKFCLPSGLCASASALASDILHGVALWAGLAWRHQDGA